MCIRQHIGLKNSRKSLKSWEQSRKESLSLYGIETNAKSRCQRQISELSLSDSVCVSAMEQEDRGEDFNIFINSIFALG